MRLFLQRWAYDHGIQFKLFNPTRSVRDRLERADSMSRKALTGQVLQAPARRIYLWIQQVLSATGNVLEAGNRSDLSPAARKGARRPSQIYRFDKVPQNSCFMGLVIT